MPRISLVKYRELIEDCWAKRRELTNAVSSHDQRVAWMWCRDATDALKSARTAFPAERDSRRAAFVISTNEILLARKKAEFDAVDVLITKLAFGKGP